MKHPIIKLSTSPPNQKLYMHFLESHSVLLIENPKSFHAIFVILQIDLRILDHWTSLIKIQHIVGLWKNNKYWSLRLELIIMENPHFVFSLSRIFCGRQKTFGIINVLIFPSRNPDCSSPFFILMRCRTEWSMQLCTLFAFPFFRSCCAKILKNSFV